MGLCTRLTRWRLGRRKGGVAIVTVHKNAETSVGSILRSWRQARRLSQMSLAGMANISTRHLSFVETGRSNASAQTLVMLAQSLGMPLEDCNKLLLAGGYAPKFNEAGIQDADMAHVRHLIELILASHEPFPAFVVDKNWKILFSNRSHDVLFEKILNKDSLEAINSTNLMRIFFHPKGFRTKIANWPDVSRYFTEALRYDAAVAPPGSEAVELLSDVERWNREGPQTRRQMPASVQNIALPIKFRFGNSVIGLIPTALSFTSPMAVTLQNLRLETFYPADEASEKELRLLLA